MRQYTLRPRSFESLREATPHVAFVAIMVFFTMYARLLLSPLLVFLQADLGVGPARATRLFLTLSLSYSPVMLLSGFFTVRLLHRRTIALSGVFVGLGLIIISLAPTLLAMHIGVAIVGGGAGLYPPAGVASVTTLVRDEIRGKAVAIHELGPNSAFMIAPLAVSAGILLGHWRWVPGISGAVALVVAMLFDRYSVAGGFSGEPPRLNNLRAILRQPQFWALTVFFSLSAAATMGVFAILPTYLVTTKGYNASLVNTVISISRAGGVVMVFFAGFMVDRLGVRRLVMLLVGLTGVLTIGIGALSGTAMLAAVFLQPLVIVAFFPAAVSAIADLGPPSVRSVAVSVMIPAVNVIAAGVFPALMGYLTEAEMVELGFIGLGLVMIGSLVLVRFLPGSDHSPGAGENAGSPSNR